MQADGPKVTALIGAALVAIGPFLPMMHVPKRGSITLMAAPWAWVGWTILALGALAALLALLNRTRHVIWPGIATLGLLAYGYVQVSTEIERARLRVGGGIGSLIEGDPLAKLKDIAALNTRYEYGWAVLVFGALALVAAGVLAWRGQRVGTRGGS